MGDWYRQQHYAEASIPFYCLIVNGEQVPPSCHGGAFQLQDKLFHKALLVNSVLYKGV